MATTSPPKPWERRNGMPATAATPLSAPSAVTPTPAPTITSALTTMVAAPTAQTAVINSPSAPPPLPSRPAGLAAANNTALGATSGYSPYNNMNNRYGSGLGGYGAGYGGYSSPYNRFGGYGGGMYGGIGGMGMGGMGMGYGGYGSGLGADPNDPNSLMRGMESSTAATFHMIESIVGAFGGFAQMLESTFMATHSSFFAMVQVAEQFGNLRNTLGQILGIFTVMRWARIAFAKLTGRPLPAGDLTPAGFAAFAGGPEGAVGPNGRPLPRPSKKPFFFFVLAVFGLPYLMGKLIKSLAAKQEEEHKRQLAAAGLIDANTGLPIPGAQVGAAPPNPMDPSTLEFARVKFDYTPEGNQAGVDLDVKKGDLVAILGKTDPMGMASQWWRCRARDSRVGYLPSPYLEVIVRRPKTAAGGPPQTAPGSQTAAAKAIEAGNVDGVSRAATMNSTVSAPVLGGTNPGDISLESFQKSQFFS